MLFFRLELITIFTSLCFLSVFLQHDNTEKPNYSRIKRNIKKTKSDLNYSLLFKKYNNAQSTMTLKEKRHLYYGFIYQTSYKPFNTSKYRDSLTVYSKGKITKNNIDKLLFFSNHALQENPFNIEVLIYKAYLYKKNKNFEGFKITKNKLNIIYSAISSSGDGLSKSTAYHVIYRNHKMNFLKHKKLTFNGIRKTIDKHRIEYLNVKQNKQKIRGLYFNVKAFQMNLKSKR